MTDNNQPLQEPDEELAQFLQDYQAQQPPSQPNPPKGAKKFLGRLWKRP